MDRILSYHIDSCSVFCSDWSLPSVICESWYRFTAAHLFESEGHCEPDSLPFLLPKGRKGNWKGFHQMCVLETFCEVPWLWRHRPNNREWFHFRAACLSWSSGIQLRQILLCQIQTPTGCELLPQRYCCMKYHLTANGWMTFAQNLRAPPNHRVLSRQKCFLRTQWCGARI